MRESKGRLKNRLQAEGRWREAIALRERLKAEGVPIEEAYRRVCEAFQPLDGRQTVYAPPWKAKK